MNNQQLKTKKYYIRKALRITTFILINILLYYAAKHVYHETGTVSHGVHLKNTICIIMLYIVFYSLSIYLLFTIRSFEVLISRGIKTEAKIIDQYNSSKFQHIKYQYQDNKGSIYIKRYGIDKKQYEQFNQKGYIRDGYFEVIYDPLNPKRSYPTCIVNKLYI